MFINGYMHGVHSKELKLKEVVPLGAYMPF